MEVAEHHFRIMASEAQLIVTAAQPAAAAFQDAVLFLKHLERRWSRFLSDSDISRLNNAQGMPLAVDPTTIVLVSKMIEAWQLTAGGFDPTVLPVLVASGYDTSLVNGQHFTILPKSHSAAGNPIRADLDSIAIDPAMNTIRMPSGMFIDPGGIGKGLASDLAVARFMERGAMGALVSIGGDMAMAGLPPAATDDHDRQRAWTVHIARPDRSMGDLCTLGIDSGGVATSSTCSRRWEHEGRDHHHLIDGTQRTESDTDLASVTVVAACGWIAEAHATAAILAGSGNVRDYLLEHQLTGVAIPQSGNPIGTGTLDSCGPETFEALQPTNSTSTVAQ